MSAVRVLLGKGPVVRQEGEQGHRSIPHTHTHSDVQVPMVGTRARLTMLNLIDFGA